MAVEVKLPALGENVPGGDVIDVRVAVGETVALEQPLFDVEAEKSTVSIPAPAAGKVAKLLVKKGDHVETGQTVAVIEGSDGKAAPPATQAKEEPAQREAAPAQPPAVPPKEPGPKGAALAQAPASPKPPARPAAPPSGDAGLVHAGPATRRLAREWGVDLGQVPGTGPKGRVSQDDVRDFVRTLAAGGGPGSAGAAKAPPLPDFARWGPVEEKPLETIRKRTAEHMRLCWRIIPHVTHHDFADVTELESFRKQHDGQGPKLTVTAFALKALAILLRQHPPFNASLDEAGGRIVYKRYYHLGLAVDTDKGLVVPVLRDVDKKSVQELAREMSETADRARQGKLTPDDMQGGTFTVSNLGGIGGVGFSPIVNWPQVAILGMSRARQQAVWQNGQWIPRLHLPLSLSYDHRVIDGAAAARFCRALAGLLENPLVMLLHA
jgi:pyruvate dehydrogenase E2 component (dihydrolipoamide acetyltransferase)